MGNRALLSPSPQPSPQGEGAALSVPRSKRRRWGKDWRQFSLSLPLLGERVGVRGNGIDARQRTSRRQLDLPTENVEEPKDLLAHLRIDDEGHGTIVGEANEHVGSEDAGLYLPAQVVGESRDELF